MRFFYFIILALLVISCAQAKIKIKVSEAEKDFIKNTYIRTTEIKIGEDVKEIVKEPEIYIATPRNGEIVNGSTIIVKLNISNFKLVTPDLYPKNGEGHFHVWLDSEKKLGPQTRFTFENVSSGKHAIVAELVKSDHSSLSPKITKAIAINVESDFVPKVEQPQVGAGEFAVEADDNGFYPDKIQAKIGDTIKINFKFRDSSIYFAGLDVKGPFTTLHYKLNGQQPLTASFEMKEAAKIDSYWPSSGVHKATLNVEVAK